MLNSTFHAKNRRRHYDQNVTKKADTTEVEPGETRSWTSVRLGVPAYIPESRLDGCDMIDIAYELQVLRPPMADPGGACEPTRTGASPGPKIWGGQLTHMASASLLQGSGVEPKRNSGTEPLVDGQGQSPLKLTPFLLSDAQWKQQIRLIIRIFCKLESQI